MILIVLAALGGFILGAFVAVVVYFRLIFGCWPWENNRFTRYLDTL